MEFIYEKTAHPPIDIKYPKDFEKWIENEMLAAVIYNRWKKTAYCVHCGNTWSYERDFNIYSGDCVTCPCCGKEQIARPHTSEWREWETFFWMWNDKCGINYAVVEARWRYEKTPIEETHLPVTICLDMCGRISREEQSCYSYYPYRRKWGSGSLCIDSQCYYPEHYPGNKMVLKRSFLKHCAPYIPDAGATHQLRFMKFFTKHPQAEYLEKAGFGELVESAVYRFPLNIYPNWNARTVPGILRLSPQDMDKLKAWGMLDLSRIAFYQLIRKYKKNPKKEDMEMCLRSGLEISDFHKLMVPGTSPMKFIRYINKQADILRSREGDDEGEYNENMPMCHAGYYYVPPSPEERTRREYHDYIDLINKLGYPKDDYYIYPKDLTEAHDKASGEYTRKFEEERKQKYAKANAKYEKEILPEIERFAYKDDMFSIRPLRSHEDFVIEGTNNHNCVATYWNKAVEGRARIFVLRRCEAPNISYVTLELSPDNRVVQCYETGNRIPCEKVTAWVDKWLKEIVLRRLKKAARSAAKSGGQMLCQTA